MPEFHVGRYLFECLNRSGVPADVTNQVDPELDLDHLLVRPSGQLTGGKLIKCAAEGKPSISVITSGDQFCLQCKKALNKNWAQGSIGKTPSPHVRASRFLFNTLIFQPFGDARNFFFAPQQK